jgi:hypothetical protein
VLILWLLVPLVLVLQDLLVLELLDPQAQLLVQQGHKGILAGQLERQGQLVLEHQVLMFKYSQVMEHGQNL